MANGAIGGFADLSRYIEAANQPQPDFLSSLMQGFQTGQSLVNLPQTIAAQQEAEALKQIQGQLAVQKAQLQLEELANPEAALQRRIREAVALEQIKPIEVGGSLVRRNPTTGKYESVFTGQGRVTPSQFAGLTTTPEGATQGVIFRPETGTFEAKPLPAGVTDIRPKVTQPVKTASARGLTPNMQNSILRKAAESGIDPENPKYVDETTGTFDFIQLSIDGGKAAAESKRTQDAIKAQGLTGDARKSLENLNAASKQLDSLQDTILEISKTGKTPRFYDNALAAVTAAPPGGWWGSLVNQGAEYFQSDDSKYLEGKKSVINSALTKAISGLAVSEGEARRLGFLPRPGESFDSLVRKVGLVEDYINNQRAGLSEGSTVPTTAPSPSAPTATPRETTTRTGLKIRRVSP